MSRSLAFRRLVSGVVPMLAAAIVLAAPWMEGRDTATGLWIDLGVHLVALAAAGIWLGRRRALPFPAGGAPLLWFPCVVTLASLRAPYAFAAGLAQFEILTALGVALSVGAQLARPSGRRAGEWLARAWVLSAGVAAVAALGEALLTGRRGAAGFVNPNHLAAFLVASVPFALLPWMPSGGRSTGGEPVRSHWLNLAALLLIGGGVLATGSRAALVALAGGGVAALSLARRRSRPAFRLATPVAAGVVAVFLAAALLALGTRFAGGADVYRYDRLRIWPRAAAMALASPVLGIGPGQFGHQAAAFNFPREESAVRYGRTFSTPHSHLLLVLVETGVIGLAVLALTAVVTIRAAGTAWAGRAARGEPPAASLALLMLGLMSLFDEPLSRPPLMLATGTLLALALGPPHRRARRRRGSESLLAVTAVTLLALAGAVAPTLAERSAREAASTRRPARRAELLERAGQLNRLQPFYPAEEAALLLSRATRPLDLTSYARIRTLIDRAVDLDPREGRLRLTRARLERRACVELLREVTACGRAATEYAQAAELLPTDPRVRREASSFAWLTGERQAAIHDLKRAVEVEPGYVGAWADLTLFLAEMGRLDEAERARKSLEVARAHAQGVSPESPYARDILADAPESPSAPSTGGGR